VLVVSAPADSLASTDISQRSYLEEWTKQLHSRSGLLDMASFRLEEMFQPLPTNRKTPIGGFGTSGALGLWCATPI
jgi:hypothetical protein